MTKQVSVYCKEASNAAEQIGEDGVWEKCMWSESPEERFHHECVPTPL